MIVPVNVLFPAKSCVPVPPRINEPVPDNTPSNVLLIDESISKVAPVAILKFPLESLLLPQFPANLTLPA